jgi:S-adenosylmethionine:tRNA ribosyltransferase-isomerase
VSTVRVELIGGQPPGAARSGEARPGIRRPTAYPDRAIETAAFHYDLPEEAIAQHAVEPRHAARLLVDGDPPRHHAVADLPDLLEPGDLVVVNDTRVLNARLRLRRATGAAVEALLLDEVGDRTWEALLRPSRRIHTNETLLGPPDLDVVASLGEGRWHVRFGGDVPVTDLLAAHGEVPLPPYLTGPLADPERYQTVYARRPASAAAPTAGLHLTTDVFARLAERGIDVAPLELVVGLGTFRPITAARVDEHVMHAERYRIPPETVAAVERAPRVVAIGTTTVRALESWEATGVTEGCTSIYLHRASPPKLVDRLLTNFHVPASSLLVLIDAFVGDRWRELYRTALSEGYRFLSLGDAMLIRREGGR